MEQQISNDTIKEIIRSEKFVPTKLVCAATMKNPTKKNEETTLIAENTVIGNELDQAPRDYTLTEKKRENVHLDMATINEINSIGNGIEPMSERIFDAYKNNTFRTADALLNYQVNNKNVFKASEIVTLKKILALPFVKLYKSS